MEKGTCFLTVIGDETGECVFGESNNGLAIEETDICWMINLLNCNPVDAHSTFPYAYIENFTFRYGGNRSWIRVKDCQVH